MPYKLRIVGDGSYRRELKNLAEELAIDDRVEFLGFRRDIPEILWMSDVFVHLPEWQEGFGITVIEAMAAGKICIVNDHGALPEIITDGVNGFIVDDGDRDFKRTIKEVYRALTDNNSPVSMQRIRENAITRAKAFSIESYSDNLDSMLMELVNKT